jgi:hypothetical protein
MDLTNHLLGVGSVLSERLLLGPFGEGKVAAVPHAGRL